MTEDNANAAPFRKMADDIMHNAANEFGGAFVIAPPKDAGKPVITLLLDNNMDAMQFWTILQKRCEATLAELALTQRNQQAGPAFARR